MRGSASDAEATPARAREHPAGSTEGYEGAARHAPGQPSGGPSPTSPGRTWGLESRTSSPREQGAPDTASERRAPAARRPLAGQPRARRARRQARRRSCRAGSTGPRYAVRTVGRPPPHGPTIISHRHRFIFVRTHKTASTSVEIALSRICGPEDVITPFPDRQGLSNPVLPIRARSHRADLRSRDRALRLQLLRRQRSKRHGRGKRAPRTSRIDCASVGIWWLLTDRKR